jgi:hypothetical protein
MRIRKDADSHTVGYSVEMDISDYHKKIPVRPISISVIDKKLGITLIITRNDFESLKKIFGDDVFPKGLIDSSS